MPWLRAATSPRPRACSTTSRPAFPARCRSSSSWSSFAWMPGSRRSMYEAQARLADAYLASGQAAEARVIAEDLVTRQSGDPASVARLRSALEMLQVEGIDAVIAEHTSRSQSADPTEALDDVPADPPAPVTAPAPTTPAPAPVASAAPSAAAPVAHPAPPAPVPVAPVGHSAPPGPTTTASAPVAPPAPRPAPRTPFYGTLCRARAADAGRDRPDGAAE